MPCEQQRRRSVSAQSDQHLLCSSYMYFKNNFLYLSHLVTKPIKWHVRPAKTLISLGIRIHLVWSVFTVRMKKAWVLSYPLSTLRRLWSDWVDAQADLSLRCGHRPFCWFCHKAAHFWIVTEPRSFGPNMEVLCMLWGARWLSGRVSDSGARGPGFETYRRRVVSLSKTLYSPKVLVNYPGSDGSVPIWLKNCWLGR